MKKIAALIFILCLSGPILLTNCSSDEEIDPGVAPEIPPVSTMVMDFGIMNADGGRLATKNNWGFSVLNVTFWNAAITLTFAVPVLSFAESFNHTPTFDPDIPGWVWEYDFGANYHARLEAVVTTEAVEWSMFITQDGAFTDFNWYTGTSALNGLSGQWILNIDPNEPQPFIQVDWNRSLTGDVADIKYLNVTPNSDDNGSFIQFEVGDFGDFNRFYDIYSNPHDNTTEIEWHSTNINGRVKDIRHFGDAEYHCWDEMLDDIDCPI